MLKMQLVLADTRYHAKYRKSSMKPNNRTKQPQANNSIDDLVFGLTSRSTFYGGWRRNYWDVVWRFCFGRRCFGDSLKEFECESAFVRAWSLVVVGTNCLNMEVRIFGVVICVDLVLTSGRLKKMIRAEVAMDVVVEVMDGVDGWWYRCSGGGWCQNDCRRRGCTDSGVVAGSQWRSMSSV